MFLGFRGDLRPVASGLSLGLLQPAAHQWRRSIQDTPPHLRSLLGPKLCLSLIGTVRVCTCLCVVCMCLHVCAPSVRALPLERSVGALIVIFASIIKKPVCGQFFLAWLGIWFSDSSLALPASSRGLSGGPAQLRALQGCVWLLWVLASIPAPV